MEDVNMMSSLICEEDISKELQQFNVRLLDQAVLAKLKNICLIYDFSAEKLVGEWLGFCSKRTWSSDLDLAKVELFENEGFRQEKLKLVDSETKFRSDSDKQPQQQQIQLDADMLNDYGVTLTDEDLLSKKSVEPIQTDGNQPNDPKAHSPTLTTNGLSSATGDPLPSPNELNQLQNKTSSNGQSTNDCVLENQLNECVELGDQQNVLSHFGERLSAQQWMNGAKGGDTFTVKPLDSDLHIARAYKSAQIKLHESNEILNEMVDEMGELVRRKLAGQGEQQDGEEQTADSLFVGRVNLDTKDANAKTLLFESARFRQKKLRLDLSKVASYSLFPGKIVCFDGELVEPDSLLVNRFVDEQLLLAPFRSTPPVSWNGGGPLHLMLASGPLAPQNSEDLSSLEHLLDQVRLLQPHYLLLLGPFFDCRNDYLLFNCDGEQFFNSIMRKISTALQEIATEAIVVPSTFDLNNYNIFPAPPFEHSYPKIRFMPNPSFLDLNGIAIALSSVDIVRHLKGEEIKRTDSNSNDQERICEHLLTQRSLYPLIPPHPDVNLEYAKLDFIKFAVRPHLFVLPSMIRSFAKNVHGSLFLNPEYISKGCYAKLRIDAPPAGHSGSIAPFTHIEIIKHKTAAKH